jgi:hypothetical protein
LICHRATINTPFPSPELGRITQFYKIPNAMALVCPRLPVARNFSWDPTLWQPKPPVNPSPPVFPQRELLPSPFKRQPTIPNGEMRRGPTGETCMYQRQKFEVPPATPRSTPTLKPSPHASPMENVSAHSRSWSIGCNLRQGNVGGYVLRPLEGDLTLYLQKLDKTLESTAASEKCLDQIKV